jgi:hypothetical protein
VTVHERHLDEETMASFVRGESDEEATHVISQHVRECPLCVSRIADLTAILNTFDILGGIHRQSRYPGDLASELRKSRMIRAEVHPHIAWPLHAAAAAVVAIVSLVVLHQRPPDRQLPSRAHLHLALPVSPGSMPSLSRLAHAKPDVRASLSMISVPTGVPTRPPGRLAPPRIPRKGDHV